MKSSRITLVRSILVAFALTISASAAMAYTHDSKGWIDDQHHHHDFTTDHGHRGYWNKNKHGIWAFIRV